MATRETCTDKGCPFHGERRWGEIVDERGDMTPQARVALEAQRDRREGLLEKMHRRAYALTHCSRWDYLQGHYWLRGYEVELEIPEYFETHPLPSEGRLLVVCRDCLFRVEVYPGEQPEYGKAPLPEPKEQTA